MNFAQRARFPILAIGMLTLLAAIWGGLARLGLELPLPASTVSRFHGPLMVAGFLSTLISLERAVALGKNWSYSAPLLAGAGSLILIAGLSEDLGRTLMTVASAILCLIFVFALKRQPELFTVIMSLGAVALLVGNVLWMAGQPAYWLSLWWGAFLIFTITGERLELSRLLQLSHVTEAAFLLAIGAFATGLILAGPAPSLGLPLTGAAMLALTAWLWLYDIARRTVRRTGLTRFIAVCLLTAYLWLGVAGALALAYGGEAQSGWIYDALLHTIFLGFTFSMIFGHAPIIFPAVLSLPMSYRPIYYLPLIALTATLALRVAADLTQWLPGRQWGGALNGLAVLLFLFNTAYSVIRSKTATAR